MIWDTPAAIVGNASNLAPVVWSTPRNGRSLRPNGRSRPEPDVIRPTPDTGSVIRSTDEKAQRPRGTIGP